MRAQCSRAGAGMLEPCPSAEGKKLQRMVGWVWGKAHFCPHSRGQGRNALTKGFCFNFQCEICVACLVFLPVFACACAHTHSHTCTLLSLGCLGAFASSYNTGKSFTALSVLEYGLKLQHSWFGCLIPSFDHGAQSVVQGCPQPPALSQAW